MSADAKRYRDFLGGDNDALAELIRDYKDGLVFFLNSYVHNPIVAEELMEETFVRLYVKRPHFSGTSQFKTWLFGVGRNVAREYLRQKSAHTSLPLDHAETLEDETYQPELTAEQNESNRLLLTAISRLSPQDRQILYLTYFENLSNRETAKVMKKSVNHVAVLLHRARQALKAELMKEGIDGEILS